MGLSAMRRASMLAVSGSPPVRSKMTMRYRGRGRSAPWSGACMRPILRGSGRWEGKSAGPGRGDLEVGDDRTGDSQQSGQELNRVPTLLASGAQNAGKDL